MIVGLIALVDLVVLIVGIVFSLRVGPLFLRTPLHLLRLVFDILVCLITIIVHLYVFWQSAMTLEDVAGGKLFLRIT